MNAKQAARFQQLLEEACDHHLDDGGTIAPGQFESGNNAECPMKCLFGRVSTDFMALEASSMLDTTVTTEEIWACIWAFDGKGYLDLSSVSATLIGHNLRAKYIKEST